MKTIIGSAVAAGFMLFAGQALAEPVGYIGGNYNYNELNQQGEVGQHLNGYSLEGAVAYDAFSKFRLTGDASMASIRFNHASSETKFWAGTLHATDKDSRFGAFIGAADNEDETLWSVGGEGKFARDNYSLYGQVGYGQVSQHKNVDLWAVRVEGNYFLNNNVRLGAGLGSVKIDSKLMNVDMFTASAEAEYKLSDKPLSFVAGYDYGKNDDANYNTNVIRAGIRYTFGGDLKARDKSTAGQGSVQTLFGGAMGSALISVLGAALSDASK